jgi:hypothetical protein
MPSTYTVNLGIEKPATGEQSGTWGDTVNDNSNILDEAINGVVSITLASAGSSGSPNSITITNGALSTGRNKWIEFTDGGDLGAAAYVQLTPNDAEKICFIRNSLTASRSIFLFQGTYNASNDLEIAAGTDVVVKFNGGGTGATVVNVYANLKVDGIVATTADINGGTVDGTVIGGAAAAALTATTVVANTSLNIAGTTTISSVLDEDNMASDSATALATQQSIKAYVDAQVGTVDTLAEILANGNTTGGTDIVVSVDDVISMDNGTNLLPSLTTTGDLNTGLYFPAADEVGLTVGGTQRLNVSATGIDVTGTATMDGLTVSTAGVTTTKIEGTQAKLQFFETDTTDSNYQLRLNGGDLIFDVLTDAGDISGEVLRLDSTGIDVTGTATMDGLTVDGIGQIELNNTTVYSGSAASVSQLSLKNFDTTTAYTPAVLDFSARGTTTTSSVWQIGNAGLNSTYAESDFFIKNRTAASTYAQRFLIEGNGDISFYEDTGTTPKFVWDSSAESLDISGAGGLTVDAGVQITSNVGFNAALGGRLFKMGTHGLVLQGVTGSTNDFAVTTPSGQLLITNPVGTNDVALIPSASGNVGIGTSSPAEELHITAAIPTIRLEDSDDGSRAEILYNVGSGGLVLRSDQGASASSTSNIIAVVDAVERLRITSDGNLGIGTSSPARNLVVKGSAPHVSILAGTNTENCFLDFGDEDDDNKGRIVYANSDDSLAFYSNAVEKMRIDSSGRVGIGTDSPQQVLQISQGAGGGTTVLRIENTETGIDPAQVANAIEFYTNDASAGGTGVTGKISHVAINAGTTYALAFSSYNGTTLSEAMRIDSNGNLLVGKTATDISTVGHQFLSDGQGDYAAHTSDGTRALLLNRKTSDGEIVDFRKDGTSVGSIGTNSAVMYLGSDDVGLRFDATSNALSPWNTTTAALNDAGIDLGRTTGRFKNLYLSGGVYLGGTGAANLLDDYEEGTWTATVADASTGGNTSSTYTGRYRKVGTLVTVFCSMTNIDTTGLTAANVLYVQGLPFTSNANNQTVGVCKVDTVDLSTRTYVYSNMGGNDSWLNFQAAGDSIAEVNIDAQHVTSGVTDIEFTMQYIT